MAQANERFLKVVRGLMRPLVRTLIARGVTAPAFYKLLKAVYVDVAHAEFRIGNEPPTDSRITLLTGVHRRDVRTILSDDSESWETARAKTAMFATVLGQWMVRDDYADADGAPRPLPRAAASGPSFEALVRDVNTDIRPRTVLDELIRQSLVIEDEDGLLRITDIARRGPASDEDRLVFFASNVGDHLAAASMNLMSEEPPFFERAVFYNRMTPGAVDRVEARARALSQTLLETLNAESQALRRAGGATPDGEGDRYRLGIYFYRESDGQGEDRAGNDDHEDD